MKNFTWHKHFAFWPATIDGKRIWLRVFWRRKRFGAAHLWELAMQRGKEYPYLYEEKTPEAASEDIGPFGAGTKKAAASLDKLMRRD